MENIILCSNCFHDRGLKLDAQVLGLENHSICPQCGSLDGKKLDQKLTILLMHRFFVWGSLYRVAYGAAPLIQFNQSQKTSVVFSSVLDQDVRLLENATGCGLFHYGPRLWMLGEIEPLKKLQQKRRRSSIIKQILKEYPTFIINSDHLFYRVRKEPKNPADIYEYDSPPDQFLGSGRLDSTDLPIMYCSEDLHTCIHECRFTAEDDLYVATLVPTKELKLLDLSFILDEDTTEFESLDLAVHMLFLAGKHSYGISQDLALSIFNKGFDGVIYPSYFSLLRTGSFPFETTYGISHRRISDLKNYESRKIIPNIALFGRPIREGIISVKCMNRIMITKVSYDYHFGPVEYL